jgi:hypothetical protein
MILQDEQLQARLATAARLRAVEKFDQDRIVPLYEAYYERIRERYLENATLPV